MPNLEFTCKRCGCDFESVMKHGAPVTCPACGTHEDDYSKPDSMIEKWLFSKPSPHQWKCSSKGAMPRRGR